MSNSFLTLKSDSKGIYKEKGSKFLAFAFPADSKQKIMEKVQSLKKEYHDAKHYCYAYILDPDGKNYRAYDDGEPIHSAGDPILGQIKTRDLTNVLVVVIRYFGGTKLGVRGLINAYKTAASQALSKAVIIKKEIREKIKIEYNYDDTNQIMKLIKDHSTDIVKQQFDERCLVEILVASDLSKKIKNKLEVLKARGFEISYS